jgi:hypothetical protein
VIRTLGDYAHLFDFMGMHGEFRSFVGWVKNLRFIGFHDALGLEPARLPPPLHPERCCKSFRL